MRILVVASPWLGGSGKVGLELAKALTARNEVHFVSFDFPQDVLRGSRVESHIIYPRTYSLFDGPIYTETLAEHIIRLCRAYDIDVIHAHYGLVFGTAAMIAKNYLKRNGYRTKLVTTFHGTDAVGFKTHVPGLDVLKAVNAEVVDVSDVVTVPTGYMKEFLATSVGQQYDTKIQVVSNFVNPDDFHVQSNGGAVPRSNIIHVSNFRPVKRAHEVLEVCKILRQAHFDNEFVFVGDGPELPGLKEIVRKEGIAGIRFTGKLSPGGTADEMNKAVAVLLPSQFESLGLVLLEGAACGAVPIACDVGGTSDFIKDGINGFLAPPHNPATTMARKLTKLLENKSYRDRITTGALESAERLTVGYVLPKYQNIYDGLLQANSAASIRVTPKKHEAVL